MARIVLNERYDKLYGRVGDLVHYRWKGKDCARIYVIPRNPRTEAQQANRKLLAQASVSWRELPETVKRLYNFKAMKQRCRMSGFNLYVSDYISGRIKRSAVESRRNAETGTGSSCRHSPDPLHMQSVRSNNRSSEAQETGPGLLLAG